MPETVAHKEVDAVVRGSAAGCSVPQNKFSASTLSAVRSTRIFKFKFIRRRPNRNLMVVYTMYNTSKLTVSLYILEHSRTCSQYLSENIVHSIHCCGTSYQAVERFRLAIWLGFCFVWLQLKRRIAEVGRAIFFSVEKCIVDVVKFIGGTKLKT